MLPYIIVYIALCLTGIGIPTSFAICLALAKKQGRLSVKALRCCCLVLAVFGLTLTLFTYWTLEETGLVVLHWEITLLLLLLTGISASLLAYLPLPRVLRRHTLPLAFYLVTIVPFLLTIAFFAYAMEHHSGGNDGTESSQDRGIGE